MKRKIIYVLLTFLFALSQKVLAQNVGIGTTTPAASLEVSSYSKTAVLGYTDSAMGEVMSGIIEVDDKPAGIRGEYRATGNNDGSGVLGIATSQDPSHGIGVAGFGNWVGVAGFGMPGSTAGVYGCSSGADYGLMIVGKSKLVGDVVADGYSYFSSGYKTTIYATADSAAGILSDAEYAMAPTAIKGAYIGNGSNDGIGISGISLKPNLGYGIGVFGTGNYYGIYGRGVSGGSSGITATANGASYALLVHGVAYFNGDIAGTGTFSYTSDRKLKKNIQPITGALDIIAKLKPSSYRFRVGEFGSMHLSEGTHYGVIAQELQQVLPELVSTKHFTSSDRAEKGFDYLSVNYNELIPILVKALQEQQDINRTLISRIEALEKK